MKILVIHGVGMNMRGKVQTEVFGTLTLPEYDVKIRAYVCHGCTAGFGIVGYDSPSAA